MKKKLHMLFNNGFMLDYPKGIERLVFSDYTKETNEEFFIGLLERKSLFSIEINHKLKKFNEFFINQDSVEIIDKYFRIAV